MSTGIFSIGITGMNAAQLGLLTTEHNITNASTPGYNRQRTIQATTIPLATGSGFLGQGTRVDTISRIYNNFLQEQINRSQTTASELETYSAQISQIDNMLADTNAGLSPALQDFFKGLQQVASNPASTPSRQAFISSAQALATRFQTLENRLSEQYSGVNEQITSTTTLINSYAEQIASINRGIMMAKAGSSQPPNDLLDQRDQLIADLNKEIRVNTVTESDGSLSVFIGTGQQLVVGQTVNSLVARPAAADGERMAVGLQIGSTYQELPEDLISGGNLSGYLRFRSEALDGAANSLGQLAASLATVLNTQQSLGQDLLGQTAGDAGFAAKLFLFDTSNVPKIIANTANTGTASVVATPASGASQTAGFLAPDSAGGNLNTALTASDYELKFTSATTFTVTRLSDGKVVSDETQLGGATGKTIAFDGVSFEVDITGARKNDRFMLEPTREIAGSIRVNPAVVADPRLIAAAAPVRAAAVASTNTGNAAISAPTVAAGYSIPAAPGVTLTYNATTQTFSGFPSGANPRPYTVGGGTSYTFDGITFQITGTPGNGDKFSIEANTGGVSDSRNAVLMGQLQTQQTMLSDDSAGAGAGKASFQDVYAQLVSSIGNKTREAQVTGDAQKTLLEQAQATRDGQSAVNLDEEAANLLRFQYAYQASAKMLQVGTKLFDTILSLGA